MTHPKTLLLLAGNDVIFLNVCARVMLRVDSAARDVVESSRCVAGIHLCLQSNCFTFIPRTRLDVSSGSVSPMDLSEICRDVSIKFPEVNQFDWLQSVDIF